jgi:hypothetical protein
MFQFQSFIFLKESFSSKMVEPLANANPKRLEIDDLTKNNFMQLQTILKSNRFDAVDDLEVKKWVDSGAKLGRWAVAEKRMLH